MDLGAYMNIIFFFGFWCAVLFIALVCFVTVETSQAMQQGIIEYY